MDEKHVGESNLKVMLSWVRRLLSRKLESVTNNDDTIEVTDRRKLSVKVSPEEGNRIQVKREWGKKGLYVPPVNDTVATDEEIDEMLNEVFSNSDPVHSA